MQITNASHDTDTGILTVRLINGDEYCITNPAHAQAIWAKISVGGQLSHDQVVWLEKYKIKPALCDKKKLLDRLRVLRTELGVRV